MDPNETAPKPGEHQPAAPAEPKSQQLLKQSSKDRSKSMDAIFGSGDPPVPPAEPGPKEEPPVKDPKPKDEPPVEEPPVKKEEPNLDEIDFDKPPVKKEEPNPEEDDDPNPDANRSVENMRKQLGEVGRRAKDAETKVTEQDLEIKRLMEENQKLKSDLEKPSRVAKDPMSHPKIANAISKINEDRDSVGLTMAAESRRALGSQFESMLAEFSAARAEQNEIAREQAIDALREKIGDQIGDDHVSSVIQLLSRNAGPYSDVVSQIRNFSSMAEEEIANEQSESWSKSTSQSSSLLKSIIDIPEEIAAEDPNNPQVFVANLIKDGGEEYQQRASLAQQAVIEAFFGKKPLTKSEIDQIKAAEEDGGKPLDEFLKNRSKAESRNREGAMRRTFLSMIILPELPGILNELNQLRAEKAKRDEQKRTLTSEGREKETPASKPKEPDTPASKRPSAVSGVLDAMGA